jgi:hypothetical protein
MIRLIAHPSWQACRAYGRLFRPWIDGLPSGPLGPLDKRDVAPFFRLTERYGTATSLAWALRGYRLTPEVRAFVELSLAYAREKAERRRQGVVMLARAMNAIGVEPVLLKGSAAQFGGIYPDPGFRLMSDIDLLVPAERLAASVAAAEEAGFVTRDNEDHGHAHAPQDHRDLGLMLEIHHRLTRICERDSFPAAALLERTERQLVEGAVVRIPEWSMHAALVLLHAFAWDRSRHMALVPFKALLDLAALKASGRLAGWDGVIDLVERAGERTSMVHAEVLFRELFGTSLTALSVNESRAHRIVRYYAWGAAHPSVTRVSSLFSKLRSRARNLWREPARLGKLARRDFYAGVAKDFHEAVS